MKFFNIFRKKIKANCGHLTLKKDRVFSGKEKCIIELPIKNNKTDYCHRCLEKMTIKCAWCGQSIFIGEPITLYSPIDKNFQIPKHAVIHQEDPLQLVGCLRINCADTGADRAGFWYPPGKVRRILSLFEIAIQGNTTAICNDVNNPEE